MSFFLEISCLYLSKNKLVFAPEGVSQLACRFHPRYLLHFVLLKVVSQDCNVNLQSAVVNLFRCMRRVKQAFAVYHTDNWHVKLLSTKLL